MSETSFGQSPVPGLILSSSSWSLSFFAGGWNAFKDGGYRNYLKAVVTKLRFSLIPDMTVDNVNYQSLVHMLLLPSYPLPTFGQGLTRGSSWLQIDDLPASAS